MGNFYYEAVDASGNTDKGNIEADSAETVAELLHQRDLVIVNIEEKIGLNFNNLSDIQIGGIPFKEKVFTVKQLIFMLQAGLPIIQSLEVLIEQTKYAGFQKKLRDAYRDVRSGLPLAKSFAAHDVIFDELQISLIEAGEQSGNLVEVLGQIAENMEKKHKLQTQIRSAMIYPALIFMTAIVVIIVLVIYMVPAVVDLYTDLGAADQIPAVTKFLVTLSDFFTSPLGLISVFLGMIILAVSVKFTYSTEAGRNAIDKILLNVPVFGNLITKIQIVQTTRLLNMLMMSGIPIIDALKATAKSVSNIHFTNALMYTADRVSKGAPIAVSLAKSSVIPTLMVKLIATGEDTGSLDKILEDITNFYEDEVNEITSNMTKLMEPLMLLMVGGMVAFLAIAVYLPIYNFANII